MSTATKLASSVAIASMLFMSAGMALAQTNYTDSATGTGAMTDTSVTDTPGVPNTGAGGDASMNMALLVTSGLLAAGGGLYLARKRFQAH
jgi:hypothetical protein